MRYETAVRRLRTIADRCERVSGLRDEPFLLGAYAFGTVLESRSDLDVVQVAFVLDLPPDELTWYAQPPSCASLASFLEIDKAPVEWHWRPRLWPVSNHVIRRPLRIWSAEGLDIAALEALGNGDAEVLRLPEPGDAAMREQMAAELAASHAHLRRVADRYWEREWRSQHRGSGLYPEDHLWRAAQGYLDLLSAEWQLGDRAG
jgi:hypothetical protein